MSFFKHLQKINYTLVKGFTTALQDGKQKRGQISRQLQNRTAKVCVREFI